MVGMELSGTELTHKIKSHRKSRQGCGNCKLRKVKCDESKPKCNKCIAYGVFCNYDEKYSDLQLSVDGAYKFKILKGFSPPMNESIANVGTPTLREKTVGGLERITEYQLRDRDLELVRKFQGRTVFTIAIGKKLDVYRQEIVRLSCSHPYLMHSMLALTLMHDRALSKLNTPLSTTEAFHWYRSVMLFNTKLAGPVQPSDRDPLWATAMCLGIISFYFLEAERPQEAWPLKLPSATDLNWLKMTDGKKALWSVAGSPPGGSLFDTPFPEESLLPSIPGSRLETLPSEFIKLYDLENPLTDDENPYRAVATPLIQSLYTESILHIIVGFLTFIGNMRPDFKQLLEQKDPRALLLLAYWYAKVCQFDLWWMSRRAMLEGQAICMYLERYYGYQADIMKLLEFPKTCFRSFPS